MASSKAQTSTTRGGRKKKTTATASRCTGAPAPRRSLKAPPTAKITQDKGLEAMTGIEETPLPKVDIILTGEPYDDNRDRFCSRCQEIGTRGCDFCPRIWCSKCIVPTAIRVPKKFKCPHCHHFAEPKANTNPYRAGFAVVGERSTREPWTRCLPRPLIIISARLVGMPYTGSAAAVIYQNLYTYLQGNLAVADFDFELDSAQGPPQLQANLHKIATELNSGSLERFKTGRFLVIMTDHSSPDTGDLHIVPDNLAAAPLGQVLDAFLDGGLRAILKNGEHSTLVLHSCGGVVAHADPLAYLATLTQSTKEKERDFSQVVAFGQQNLQLFFTNSFLTAYAVNFFIHGKPHIGSTIYEQPTLGAHTDVIWFQDGKKTRFFWGHLDSHPHGKAAPLMCDKCHRLKPWYVHKQSKNQKEPIIHTCKGCQQTVEYKLLEGANWVHGCGYNADQGAWFIVKQQKPASS